VRVVLSLCVRRNVVPSHQKVLPNVDTLSAGYRYSQQRRRSFLTRVCSEDFRSMIEASSYLVGGPVPRIDLRVEDETGKEVEVAARTGNWVARGATSCGLLETIRKTPLSHFETNVSHGNIGYRDSDGLFLHP